jgi:hypothetical protein
MGEVNHVEFGAAQEGPEAIENWMKTYSPDIAVVSAASYLD